MGSLLGTYSTTTRATPVQLLQQSSTHGTNCAVTSTRIHRPHTTHSQGPGAHTVTGVPQTTDDVCVAVHHISQGTQDFHETPLTGKS